MATVAGFAEPAAEPEGQDEAAGALLAERTHDLAELLVENLG